MGLDVSHPGQGLPISAIHQTADATHFLDQSLLVLWLLLRGLCLHFVDLGLSMEHLHRLKSTVNEAGSAVQKTETEKISIEKKQDRRTGQAVEMLLEPTTALGLRAEKRRRKLTAAFLCL